MNIKAKIVGLIITIATLTTLLSGCAKYNDAIDNINNRLDKIEQTTIPTINEQICSINESIEILHDLNQNIENWIYDFVRQNNEKEKEVALLKEQSEILKQKVDELKNYIDNEITKARDDAAAAYATLSLLNEVKIDVADLREITNNISTDIEALNQKIDQAIESLDKRVSDLEKRVSAIEDSLSDILKRIQTLSYIPRYEDGKATMKYLGDISQMALDFEILPKSAVEELSKAWSRVVSLKAIYTESRAISFVKMPIQSFKSDLDAGIITIVVSGENLIDDFYSGKQKASVALTISDGNSAIISDYITILPQEASVDEFITPIDEIWYTTYSQSVVSPYATNAFAENILSNLYNQEMGIISFDAILRTIGNMAFYSCIDLTSISIPECVSSIGNSAFYGCSRISSLTLPDSITEIGDEAFKSCENLTTISLPNGIVSIGSAAFSYCRNLSEITIPERITTIKRQTFSYCQALTNIAIPNSVTTIGESAFSYCSALTKIVIGDKVSKIEDFAFCNCTALSKVNLPDNVTSIGNDAYSDCSALTSVTIGSGISSIGDGAFFNCKKLNNIYCKSLTPPTLQGEYTFDAVVEGRKIYVPTASVEAYKAAKWWSIYAEEIVGYDF